MRDFCHETRSHAASLSAQYRVTYSFQKKILKQVFIYRDSFQIIFDIIWHTFFVELYCFLLSEATDCHALT